MPRFVAFLVMFALIFVGREGRTDPEPPQTADEPHYARAGLEVVGLMGLGLLYYWQDPLANSQDWDNPSLGDRASFRAVRFDTNLDTTNHLLHPIAGALVYDVARVNGLSVPVAFGYGAAQSLLWELALEWREKASVNDLVFTAIGGVPLGEALHALGEYLNSAPGGGRTPQEAAAWTLGFPRRIHRVIDGDGKAPPPLPPDELGFSSAYGHRFAVAYEAAILTNETGADGSMHSARIDTEIVSMPRFLQPMSFARAFWDANFTETHLRLGFAESGLVEADLEARATLFGHYVQELDGDAGHALMLGFGPGLRFQQSRWLGRADQLSTVHIGGPQAELWIREGALAARFGGEAYVDFAGLESLAYPAFTERYGAEGTKSVLQRQGYAYSVGSWGRFRASAAFGLASAFGSVGYGRYDSVEGADRFQERVTRDVHGTESVLETELGVALHFGIVQIGAGLRERRRESTLADVLVRRRDRDLHLTVGVTF